MTTKLRERVYRVNVYMTAFIDVIDINDASARVMACEELRRKIDDNFKYDVTETELYDVDELPRQLSATCISASFVNTVCMDSYFAQLKTLSNQRDVDLRAAFSWANIPGSTYYRAKKREDMRYDTALKVLDAINRIHASKTAGQHRP